MSIKKKNYLKLNPYLEITSGIHAVLTFSEGVIKVTGGKGSGKSAICNLLLDELKQDELEAVLFEEVLESSQEFEDIIQEKLALKKVSNFVSDLTSYLVSKPAHQQKLVLIIDDSDKASDEVFQIISKLADVEHDLTPLVSIVLCGADELNEKLNEPDKKSILDKVILSLQVQPMDKAELQEYCQAYISKVGLENHHLSSTAYTEIYEKSQGFPEKIPELIYEAIDSDAKESDSKDAAAPEKRQAAKFVELADDPEPELTGLSVEEREEALLHHKEQVPWRWQSNGVAIAVVVLFLVVAYGWFRPKATIPTQVSSSSEFLDVSIVIDQDVGESAEQINEVVLSVEDNPTDDIAGVAESENIESTDEIVSLSEQETVELANVLDSLIETSGNILNTEDELEATAQVVEVIEEELIEQKTEQAEQSQQIANSNTPTTLEEGQSSLMPSPTTTATNNPAVSLDQNLLEPQRLISQWVQAWENQNLENYFDSYQERFQPTYHDTQSVWKGDRQLKISRPKYIEIDIDGLELIESSKAGLTVRFWLNYVSSYYKDRTLKEVLLTQNSLGEFLIMQEKNLQVEILPYYP